MQTSLSPKSIWIDRCASRLGLHDLGISPMEAVEHADLLWRNVAQDLSPEEAADAAAGNMEAIEQLFCHVEA